MENKELTWDQISNLDALNAVVAFINGDWDGYQSIMSLYEDREEEMVGALTLIGACLAAPPIVPIEDRMRLAEQTITMLRHHLLEHGGEDHSVHSDDE